VRNASSRVLPSSNASCAAFPARSSSCFSLSRSAIVVSRMGILHLILRKSAAESFHSELQLKTTCWGLWAERLGATGRVKTDKKKAPEGAFDFWAVYAALVSTSG